MSRFWSDTVKNIEPYVPGEQPGEGEYIKLNTNENPYSPSPKVLEAIKEAADSRLRLYPDPDCKELKFACCEVFGLNYNQVFISNGSDEALAMAFQAFFQGRSNILIPEITYSFYPVYCQLYGVNYIPVPLTEDFSINYIDYLYRGNGVVIANPNAPTSLALSPEVIEKIVANDPDRLVIVDEAYVDFGGESVLPLINKYDNLLVIQTLSKSRSLASLRVGFAFGSPELIEGLEKVKNSFNSYTIDFLAQKAAAAALRDVKYFNETTGKIIKTRESTSKSLKDLGFDVLDSSTNFLFIEHKTAKAQYIFQKLREKNIIVRYFNKPGIDNWLRVTIGTDEEMDAFIETLKFILK